MRFFLLGLLAAGTAFSLPLSDLLNETQNLPGIEVVKLENPFKEEAPKGFFYFNRILTVKGVYSVGKLLSLLANAGINVEVSGDMDLDRRVFLAITTKSVSEFVRTFCTSADLWCDYDPLVGKLRIRRYKYLTVNFNPEGKLTFSLGTGGGMSDQSGESSEIGKQSFSYRIENMDFPTFLEKLRSAFPKIPQIPSEKGFVIFKVTPSQYDEIKRWVEEREKRSQRLYASIELIRVDLSKNFQWGINWGGFTEFGDIGSLRTLRYSFTYKPITTGDSGQFVVVTKGGDERALFTWLSKYGKVYKVDSFYTQGVTGTPHTF